MDVRFRVLSSWPDGVPRTPQDQREWGNRFKAGWQATMDLLDRELRHLSAREVVIEGGWKPGHLRLDGLPRSDAPEPTDPAVVLSFDSKFGPLRYSCDTYDKWRANVRAIALSLEALRSVDRWGISKRGEQYRGWNELPSGIATEPPMTVDEAALFIAEGAGDGTPSAVADEILRSPGSLASAYRQAAKNLHPDLGGDAEAFRKLQRARETIEARP